MVRTASLPKLDGKGVMPGESGSSVGDRRWHSLSRGFEFGPLREDERSAPEKDADDVGAPADRGGTLRSCARQLATGVIGITAWTA